LDKTEIVIQEPNELSDSVLDSVIEESPSSQFPPEEPIMEAMEEEEKDPSAQI